MGWSHLKKWVTLKSCNYCVLNICARCSSNLVKLLHSSGSPIYQPTRWSKTRRQAAMTIEGYVSKGREIPDLQHIGHHRVLLSLIYAQSNVLLKLEVFRSKYDFLSGSQFTWAQYLTLCWSSEMIQSVTSSLIRRVSTTSKLWCVSIMPSSPLWPVPSGQWSLRQPMRLMFTFSGLQLAHRSKTCSYHRGIAFPSMINWSLLSSRLSTGDGESLLMSLLLIFTLRHSISTHVCTRQLFSSLRD